MLALAAHIVVTSPTTKTLVARNFNLTADRITVAEPGTARTLRARGGGVGAGAPVRLLAVGSIVPRKGHHVLIEALATLTDLDWSLDIAGADDRSPETAERVRALIKSQRLESRIRMLGAVDDARLADLYADADLFVMPSLFEGYGMVLAEAMVRGLPIVCTTGGAAAETAPDAAALKVPPGDSESLARGMRRLIEDPPLRRQMADAAWAAGQKLPRWEDTARLIADVLESHVP